MLTQHAVDALGQVAKIRDHRTALDASEGRAVAAARAAGASWGQIGRMLGITPEGARKRFQPRHIPAAAPALF